MIRENKNNLDIDIDSERKKIEKTVDILDKMAKTIASISYKSKIKLIENNIDNLASSLLKDMLLVKEINDKNIGQIHELLSEGMSIKELYEMIS